MERRSCCRRVQKSAVPTVHSPRLSPRHRLNPMEAQISYTGARALGRRRRAASIYLQPERDSSSAAYFLAAAAGPASCGNILNTTGRELELTFLFASVTFSVSVP